MSTRGWTQSDVDAYIARQSANAPKNAPAASDASTRAPMAGQPQTPANAKPGGNRGKSAQHRRPNKTEERFNRDMLAGRGVYEGLTFRLPGGSRYTPDWVWFHQGEDGISIFCVEVKGSYRFGSQGRALVAFREARAAFPLITFSWWQWDGKRWMEKYGEYEDEAAN